MKKKLYIIVLLLLPFTSNFAGTKVITGKVTNLNEEALTGASVYLKGTTFGTATNRDGTFSIKNINSGKYELVISYSGYHRVKHIIDLTKDSQVFNTTLEVNKKLVDEIVVTGTGTASHLKRSPVKTEFIGQKQIKNSSANSLENVLTDVSASFDFNPGSMGSFMSLNGLSNKYIVILVDGKRLYGDVGGNIDLNRVNVKSIDHIEVVKGASSSLYGSEAMAGVINIITKKSKSKINIESNSYVSQYGQIQQFNTVDLNFGRVRSKTSFSYKATEGWQLSDIENKYSRKTKKYKIVKTDAMAVNKCRSNQLKQELDFVVTDKLSISGVASKYHRLVEHPTTVRKYDYKHDNLGYGIGAKYYLRENATITFNYNSDIYDYYYKYNQDNIKKKKLLNIKDDEVLQKSQRRDDINVKSIFKISKSHRISVGSVLVMENLESAKRLKNGTSVSSYTFAGFAQDEYSINRNFILYGGLRYSKHEYFGYSVTPKISALYKISNFNFRTAFSQGFKAPTLKELNYNYQKGSSLYLGNKNLKPQKNSYYSAEVEYNSDLFSLSASAYRNDLKDMIWYEEVKTTDENKANGVKQTKNHSNINKARTQGVDIRLNVRFGYGFTLGGGYSFVDAKDQIKDIRLNGIARNYATVNFSWEKEWSNYGLNATITGRIQDEKFYDTKGNADGYNVWNFTTHHSFKNVGNLDFELNTGINNVFNYSENKMYGSHYGTKTPGRTVFVGVNIKFS